MESNFYDLIGNNTIHDHFCSTRCSNGLKAYRQKVVDSCGNDTQPFPGLPAVYWADWAISTFEHLCMKDSKTGEYCPGVIASFFADKPDDYDSDGLDLSESQLCSDCVVSLFKYMQSTPYSNYDESLSQIWSAIQAKCSLSYPTDVPPLQTNITQPDGFAPPGSGAEYTCLSGSNYTVKNGDDCETIAEKNHVSTGTLIAINSLYPDCSNLDVGQVLCLPLECLTYATQTDDTCSSVARNGTTVQQLISWNPSLSSDCSNFRPGTNICISPPGGIMNLTTIPGATTTTAGIYATTIAPRPSPVAAGTTLMCGKYYQVQPGDNCQLVSVNQTITPALLKAINPDLNSRCTNLELGVYYCVQPTKDWNATSSATVVSPPTSVPTGTTSNCYEQFLSSLAHFAPDDKAKQELKKLGDDKDYFSEKVTSRCLNIAQVIQAVSSTPFSAVPFSLLMEGIPKIQPRYYSISSSSLAQPNLVSITAVVESIRIPASEHVLRGVTTHYLLALKNRQHASAADKTIDTTSDVGMNQLNYVLDGPRNKFAPLKVPVHVRHSNFKLPSDPKRPVIMIGPGTGVAPFRAFVQERAEQKKKGEEVGPTILFFGCRKEEEEFLYKDEWAEYTRILGPDNFKLITAFSRAGPQKVYVQHRLRENAALVNDLLQKQQANFYVCGDASHMAREVTSTLVDIISEQRGIAHEKADEIVKRMRNSGKYLEDVWS
ncbi:hypothetical protein KEM56_003676 [Ascosphaera pollenicola]|nr:hypothetical protein KEM56_003676 [Ascosphaera pollenicola]